MLILGLQLSSTMSTQCDYYAGTPVFYNRSSANEQVPATILGPSQHPGDYLRTQYEVNGKAVIHDIAALHRLEFHIRRLIVQKLYQLVNFMPALVCRSVLP